MYCRRKAFTGLMLAASLLALNGYASVSAEKAPNIWCSDDGLAFHLYSTSMGFQSEVINAHGQTLYSMGALDCKFSKDSAVIFKCTPKWDMKGFVAMEGRMKVALSLNDQIKEEAKFRLAMQTQGKSGLDVSWNFGEANCMDLSVAKEGPSMPPQAPQPDPTTPPSDSDLSDDFEVLPPPSSLKSEEPVKVEELNKKNVNDDGSVTINNPTFKYNGEEVFYSIGNVAVNTNPEGICKHFNLGKFINMGVHHGDEKASKKTVVIVDEAGQLSHAWQDQEWIKTITCQAEPKKVVKDVCPKEEIIDYLPPPPVTKDSAEKTE